MKIDPRFLTGDGPEIFNGSELLIKGALEAAGGVHLLGGYPGSPIAGFFDTMTYIKELLKAKGIRAVINNNEALAAAMLNGSQVAGCRSIICMKSVGVHVAADALALGSLAGAHPEGGAVVIYGDDPWSDSTQVPSDSRYISRHLFIPVIEPSNPQEVKDFIDLALKLSCGSELYSGFIMPTNLADGGGSVMCRPNQYPEKNTLTQVDFDTASIDLDKYVLLPPKTWWQEAKYAPRFQLAVGLARSLELNRLEYPADSRQPIGFATSGMAHDFLIQALADMDLLGEFPILKFGMSYPMDEQLVGELAEQCQRIIVVEERRGFLEEQISQAVAKLRQGGRVGSDVEVWGKQFPNGLVGIPEIRGLHPSIVTERLGPLIESTCGQSIPAGGLEGLKREMATIEAANNAEVPPIPARLPTFCPGCPHRDSADLCLEIQKHFMDPQYMRRRHKRPTVDLVFHGDIGCYTMLMFPPNTPLMHNLSGMGLGGGTGAGMDPFITNKQVVFMGDSTFFHCGQLAISQAIKLSQDITFIILDNRTTAMTGHQPTPGVEYDVMGNPTVVQDIDDVVRSMGSGGGLSVVRVDPEKRDEYRQLLEHTFLADGVKVIIADKECAITRIRRKRRLERSIRRRLGYLPTQERMNINQDICRFCLTCAEMTGCPGLRHVETDYGRKMDTDITWCVNDGACERIGACSAFEQVTIKRKRPPRSRVPELQLDKIPEPPIRPLSGPNGRGWRCCLVGVGGMGVGLATSILVRAGHKQGYHVIFVDKKGLAIRNGGTVSQIVYNNEFGRPVTGIIPYGKADVLIGVDILEAARALDPTQRLRAASAQRTSAVINLDKANTIKGVMGQEDFDVDQLAQAIRANTRSDNYLARNISRICEKYLGSKLYANVMMLGFAFQKGLIPVSMHSMAWAIKDTIQTDFRKNLYAFNMGRKLCERMDLFQGAPQRTGWSETLEEKCRWVIRRFPAGQQLADRLRASAARCVAAVADLDETHKRAIVVRAYDCLRWGGGDYAERYVEKVAAIYAKDSADFDYAATRAAIYNLASAMLIKDAVFLAELSTSPEKLARDREKYNVNPANGDKISYRHLWHPEIQLWPWPVRFTPRIAVPHWMLIVLRGMRWLRNALPLWRRQDKQYLRQYEQALEKFSWTTPAEYHRALTGVSSPQCMNCTNPRCKEAGCPLASEIPVWVQLAYQQRWQEAAEKLLEINNFPEITSRICPGLCENACKQGISGYPVGVREIERQIAEKAFSEGWVPPRPADKKTGRKVAVVGSGPAGLAAAQQLARAGHDVTVFEKDPAAGGLLRYGIPSWRLEKQLIDRRVKQLQQESVQFRMGAEAGIDITGRELREKFDAVLLATGAAAPKDLDLPGRQKEGIVFALDFLRNGAEGDAPASAKGKTVAVIGGGLTGEDCVEAALAGGAKEVHQLEILPVTAVDTPQLTHPIEQEDLVHRRWCVSTTGFDGDGRLNGLQCVQVKWRRAAGKDVMETLPDTEFTVSADLAVLAVGFEPAVPKHLAEQLGLKTDERGRIAVKQYATGVDGVFAAGDLAVGASYVATAIDSGRKAAEKIIEYLENVR